jgi:hypothetical protein
MTTKHTPAPWKTRKGFDSDTIEVFAPNPKIEKPFRPTALAVVEADDAAGKANARLISAAPDLLAACQHVIDTHGHHAQDCCKCDDCEYLRPITDAIRKALGHNAMGDARRADARNQQDGLSPSHPPTC